MQEGNTHSTTFWLWASLCAPTGCSLLFSFLFLCSSARLCSSSDEVTVTSVSNPSFMSHRGFLNTTQCSSLSLPPKVLQFHSPLLTCRIAVFDQSFQYKPSSLSRPHATLPACALRWLEYRNLNTMGAAWSQSPRVGMIQAVQTSFSGLAAHWLIIGLNFKVVIRAADAVSHVMKIIMWCCLPVRSICRASERKWRRSQPLLVLRRWT